MQVPMAHLGCMWIGFGCLFVSLRPRSLPSRPYFRVCVFVEVCLPTETLVYIIHI
jgi:hypothetical protein